MDMQKAKEEYMAMIRRVATETQHSAWCKIWEQLKSHNPGVERMGGEDSESRALEEIKRLQKVERAYEMLK